MMSEEEKDEILKRLEQIAAASDGRLTPAEVVYDAEKDESPLHKHFEWDDALAGFQFRLEQARKLIRSVRVTYEEGGATVETVAFIRDPNIEGVEQGYISVVSLRSDKQGARAAVLHEFGRAQSALSRAREIAVALGLESEIEAIVSRLGSLAEQVGLARAEATV